jgi:hypothetical protein
VGERYEPRDEGLRARRRVRTVRFRRYLEARGWSCAGDVWRKGEARWPLQVALYRQMHEDLEATGSIDELADFVRESRKGNAAHHPDG